ncbi:MAG: hypothetical protein IJ629_04260 [Clostridia bacterium]|nr:hypothetical protein [Clostridia bacterium]
MGKKVSKKKKINIKLTIVLLVLAVVILFVIFIRLKLHDRETIRNRLLKGLDNLNYTYNEATLTGENKVYVYGKYAKSVDIEGNITYIDYTTGQSVQVSPELGYMEEQVNKGLQDLNYYNRYINSYFENNTYEYKYKGKEEYNKNTCTVVELISRSQMDGRREGVVLWINDDVNLIDKAEFFIERDGKREELDTLELRFHTGENTYNDVKVPDNLEELYSSDTNN